MVSGVPSTVLLKQEVLCLSAAGQEEIALQWRGRHQPGGT